jgi:hypothetical protein
VNEATVVFRHDRLDHDNPCSRRHIWVESQAVEKERESGQIG